ncbi:MAG: glycosyltransferase family 4 protein [Minisyncoccota bacterium]
MKYKKKLFLIFHGRFPSEKAASLFAAKECEAFGRCGLSVTLVVPRRLGRDGGDPFAYYGLEKTFRIVYIPTLDIFGVGFLKDAAFKTSFLFFSLLSVFYLIFKANKEDIIYSNESLPIILSTFYFPNTLYELHDFPAGKRFFYGLLFRRVRYLLVTNLWKVGELTRSFGVGGAKVLCERNAVEIHDFDIPISKEEARTKLGLPVEKRIIVYTGHLYSWKGTDILAEAAKMLPENTLVVFIGGTETDLARFRSEYGEAKDILIVGHKERQEIPYWQKSADVLVLPNTAKEDISKYYTSPMKLFEYMASGRPIVATDIPSVREIVSEENAIIVPPDDSSALAEGILRALTDTDLVNRITEKAYEDVLSHSWDKRAKRILDFMKVSQPSQK